MDISEEQKSTAGDAICDISLLVGNVRMTGN